jgi:hypothetical protein
MWHRALLAAAVFVSPAAYAQDRSAAAQQYCAASEALRAGLCFPTVSAWYDSPTTRYDHGILGDGIEWERLVIEIKALGIFGLKLPRNRVFEDIAPRLADLDGDQLPEVIVVETDLALGARLAVYSDKGLISATEFIGQTHRWLAPVGAADLDGDGTVEIAYVDRPHLARELVIVRFRPGKLEPVARFMAVTNHRIGDRDIAGGIRTCAGVPEIVVADAEWREVLAIRFDGARFGVDRLGPVRGARSFSDAMACK